MLRQRQGDVGLILIGKVGVALNAKGKLKPVKRENGKVILAHGEVTGHAHMIEDEAATLYIDEAGELFLQVDGDKPVKLTHQEHATQVIEPGIYKVSRQREYSPEAVRKVQD
jgi:hypothetical protein